MIQINNVTLSGVVVDGTVRSYQNAQGIYCLCFKLRTSEVWRTRDGTADHHEYHSILLKDYCGRTAARQIASKLCGGDRAVVIGKIRNRMRRMGDNSYERYVEIEADAAEIYSMAPNEDLQGLVLEPREEGRQGGAAKPSELQI